MKTVTVHARFELIDAPLYVQGRDRGSNVRAAAANAIRDLLKQPKLKHKRFTVFTATVSIGRAFCAAAIRLRAAAAIVRFDQCVVARRLLRENRFQSGNRHGRNKSHRKRGGLRRSFGSNTPASSNSSRYRSRNSSSSNGSRLFLSGQ